MRAMIAASAKFSWNRMVIYNTISTQTPVWEPELRQNTPAKGLPKDEDRWPILGNWVYDYDADGNLKPIDEIRPVLSAANESAYAAEITVADSSAEGCTIAFSQPVNKNDFALAVNVDSFTYAWNEDGTAVTVTYGAPVDREVSMFLFRSVDMNGNMIGGPVQIITAAP